MSRPGSCDSSAASGNCVGNILSKAVRRTRNAASDGLAENEEVGIKIFDPRVATGSGTNSVGFINDEQSSVLTRELAQLPMVARFGMHNPYIGHCGLGEDASHIAGLQCSLKRVDVVEFHYLGGDRRIDGRAHVTASWFTYSIF